MDNSNNNPFYGVDDNEKEVVVANTDGGVSQVTASVTISAKPLGGDAFIKLEETYQFAAPVDAGTAIFRRSDMLDILREQAIEEAKKTADAIRVAVAATPRGNVSVHPIAPAAAQGSQAGTFVPASGPQATVGVANGATPAANSGYQWSSVKAKFGDGELRFITTASMSSDQLKDNILNYIENKWSLNRHALMVWDNRVGASGLEAGVPAGCVAAVKIAKDAQDFVTPDIANQAIARVKFNADGSLYVWMTKEAEAAFKYGALDRIKAGA